jgi:hypothetical protein
MLFAQNRGDLLAFQVLADVEITDHILEGGPLLAVHSQTGVSVEKVLAGSRLC